MNEATAGAQLAGEEVREVVRRKYAEAAERAARGEPVGGCGCGCGSSSGSGSASGCGAAGAAGAAEAAVADVMTADLYDAVTASSLPERAVLASLGCGNPTALAELRPGEVVLDLGSGGGIDVLLSARRVGPTGKAYGVDMTDGMLELARRNAVEAGIGNVEFLKGDIEALPLPDASVDVVISNCVINLSADKRRVLAEAYRVLKPGGRFAVSDVVVRGALPEAARRDLELWAGCVAGALEEREFLALLAEVGFEGGSIEPTREYREGMFSAFVRATKPVEREACCGSDCCG